MPTSVMAYSSKSPIGKQPIMRAILCYGLADIHMLGHRTLRTREDIDRVLEVSGHATRTKTRPAGADDGSITGSSHRLEYRLYPHQLERIEDGEVRD